MEIRLMLSISSVIDVNPAANRIAETVTDGEIVGLTAKASSDSPVTYILENAAGSQFEINPTSGVITVTDASLINFEQVSSYPILITATDGIDTTSARFTITVTDVKPTTPIDSENAFNRVRSA